MPAPLAAAPAAGAAAGGAAGGAGAGAGAGAKAGGGSVAKGKLGGALKRRAIGLGVDAATDSGFWRRLATLLAVLGGLLLLLVLLIVAAIAAVVDLLNPFNGDPGFAKQVARHTGIPAVYWPMYTAAAGQYKVNPYLLASIHKQESGFSALTVRLGWNGCGAAGPMQFGIVGVAPYHASVPSCPNPNGAGATWHGHKYAFRPIAEFRPGSYPLHRAKLASCARVPKDVGCVYDDFDAIAGAAHKLSRDGANMDLFSPGTKRAVCAYIGSCSELANCGGVNAYCGVLPRAKAWEKEMKAVPPPSSAPIPDSGGALAWPTPPAYRSILSPFGWRFHPVLKKSKLHTGIDVPAPGGTPLAAAGAGIVTHRCQNVSPCSGYGNFVCIAHSPKLSSCYAHLSRFSAAAWPGRPVDRGEVIGFVGTTGLSTGDHLHFEVRLGRYPAQPVNPAPYLRANGSKT
jgi:hypothetical protein